MYRPGEDLVSEFIVACFGDTHRAPQVIYELRRMSPPAASDLDNGVALQWDEDGSMRVQQNVDPTSTGGAAWSSLWGAFISLALLLPRTEGLPAAANAVISAFAPKNDGSGLHGIRMEPSWWIDEFGISDDFLRDVGALVQPG